MNKTEETLKIGLITHLFPSERDQHRGKFMYDQYRAIRAIPDMKLRLMVPTPRAVPGTQRWKTNQSPLYQVAPTDERVVYTSLPNRKKPLFIQKNISKVLLQKLSLEKPDILHIHWLYPDGLAIPALKEGGYPVLLTIHGSDWYKSMLFPELKPLLINALQKVDRILCSGPQLKADILQELPELEDKIEVIYNFIDTQIYTVPSAFESLRAMEQLDWKDQQAHALCVANIRHEKGIDVLVDALSQLQNNPEYQELNHGQPLLVHVIGMQEKGEYLDSIQERLENQPELPIILHEPVSPDQLKTYYQAADFFILPSRSEGFNVSLLEASSCGLPIVATKVGGNDLVVRSHHSGKLVQAGNPEALGEAILSIHSRLDSFNPESIRKRIVTEYDLSVLTEKLRSLYSRLYSEFRKTKN
jgi:glycosyltransferase involved in cell wall biosynthesis